MKVFARGKGEGKRTTMDVRGDAILPGGHGLSTCVKRTSLRSQVRVGCKAWSGGVITPQRNRVGFHHRGKRKGDKGKKRRPFFVSQAGLVAKKNERIWDGETEGWKGGTPQGQAGVKRKKKVENGGVQYLLFRGDQ